MPVPPPRITITPEVVSLEPGVPVTITAEVFNASEIVEEFAIDIVGAEQRFATTIEPREIDLFPGRSSTVDVTVDVRTLYSASAGLHKIGVRAVPATSPSSSRVEEAAIDVQPVSEVLLDVHPRMARVGRGGAFVLVARNRGNSSADVVFSGADPEGAVHFEFDPPEIVIPPGEEVYSVAEARGSRPLIGQDAQRSITFKSVLPDPDAPEVMADTVMLQRARLAGIFSTLLVVVIAVVLFAVAFLVVDRIRADEVASNDTARADASGPLAGPQPGSVTPRQR